MGWAVNKHRVRTNLLSSYLKSICTCHRRVEFLRRPCTICDSPGDQLCPAPQSCACNPQRHGLRTQHHPAPRPPVRGFIQKARSDHRSPLQTSMVILVLTHAWHAACLTAGQSQSEFVHNACRIELKLPCPSRCLLPQRSKWRYQQLIQELATTSVLVCLRVEQLSTRQLQFHRAFVHFGNLSHQASTTEVCLPSQVNRSALRCCH